MKRELMASVLLASMAFAIPVYADGDMTPDEYNPEAKYESPLDQPRVPVVNDYQVVRADDENEAFAREAGLLTQGDASGKAKTAHAREGDDPVKDVPPGTKSAKGDSKDGRQSEKEIASTENRTALRKAEKQAEKVLLETDEEFESAMDKEYPGHEYQARKQTSSLAKTDSPDKILQQEKDDVSPVPVKRKPAMGPNGTVKAEKTGKDKKQANMLPLVITGDNVEYANGSGDFLIEGNVKLEQGSTRVFSTKAVGNAKTGDIWLLEGGTLEEPTNRVNAHWAHYNINHKTGELLHLKGASAPHPGSNKFDYYEAPHGTIENGMLVIDQGGTTTRCPAVRHPSCLSVKAKTITIIPNDRIIARGVQVFVRGKQVYSRDIWINDLKKEKNELMPRIGWKSDRGYYVSLDYSQPIGNPLLKNPTMFSMHQVYYTKSKYKPFYSIRHDQKDFYVRVNSGYVYDSDNDALDEGVWLHKKIDWGLFLKPHRIAKGLPLTIDANITHGLWKYTDQKWQSWRTEKVISLRHDRFYPLGGRKLYMDLMVGRKWVNNSLDNATTRYYGKNLHTNIYVGTLGYRFSDKWNIWATYHNEHRTDYLFSLGQPSFDKEWITGISWSPDAHNAFSIVNRHNSESGSATHGNYSTTFNWTHRFCCEVLTVSYERKHYNGDHSWTVKFNFLNW
jgi:hypothetical protein